MAISDPFARLGAALEDGWRDADRDEERFADVALGVLEAHPPSEWFRRDAFLDAVLDPHRSGIQQLAPTGAFGQPGLTAFAGEGFVIEVYYWLHSLAAIHNHPFCGVFTVLEGWSVHARYATSRSTRAGSRGQLLDVHLSGLDLVEPGHVERFSLKRHPLVHALVHIPVPTISMVLRTIRTEGYLRYLPPSIAIPMEAPFEPAARRQAMLESLVAAEDPAAEARVHAFLRSADFESAVRILSGLWPRSSGEARASLLASMAELHGDRCDAVVAALDRAARLEEASAIGRSLRDADLRLVATALAYAESREHVFGLLRQRTGDPEALLRRFVDDAGHFAADEDASRLIAHALVAGGGENAAERALEEAFGAAAVAEQRDEIARYCRDSIFSVLGR